MATRFRWILLTLVSYNFLLISYYSLKDNTGVVRALLDPQTSALKQAHLQRHFGMYGVYIPAEDIEQHTSKKKFSQVLNASSSDARLCTWIPIKVRLPLVGFVTWEWCWKRDIIRPVNYG